MCQALLWTLGEGDGNKGNGDSDGGSDRSDNGTAGGGGDDGVV